MYVSANQSKKNFDFEKPQLRSVLDQPWKIYFRYNARAEIKILNGFYYPGLLHSH
jgi:hypothetical protein